VLDALTDPFSLGIGQRALLELTILGLVCGPFGVWLVLFRQGYAAESLSHSMLPGLVAAALIGVPLGVGAALGVAVAAALIAFASFQRNVSTDAAVAVVVTTLFGLGTLLALSPEAPLRVGEILFGDPLSVSRGDLIATAILGLALVLLLAAGHRSLALVGFDPAAAPSLGGSTRAVGALILVALGATTLIAVQALGTLLLVAIILAPGASALRFCSRLPTAMLGAAVIAVASGVGGMYLSYYADVAAGASVALCALAAFVVSLPFGTSAAGTSAPSASPIDALGS